MPLPASEEHFKPSSEVEYGFTTPENGELFREYQILIEETNHHIFAEWRDIPKSEPYQDSSAVLAYYAVPHQGEVIVAEVRTIPEEKRTVHYMTFKDYVKVYHEGHKWFEDACNVDIPDLPALRDIFDDDGDPDENKARKLVGLSPKV